MPFDKRDIHHVLKLLIIRPKENGPVLTLFRRRLFRWTFVKIRPIWNSQVCAKREGEADMARNPLRMLPIAQHALQVATAT